MGKNTAVPLAGGWLCEREAFLQLPLWADPVFPACTSLFYGGQTSSKKFSLKVPLNALF